MREFAVNRGGMLDLCYRHRHLIKACSDRQACLLISAVGGQILLDLPVHVVYIIRLAIRNVYVSHTIFQELQHGHEQDVRRYLRMGVNTF